ncbi:hypothetical protein LCGC14_3050220 [marine sediment metagenome]|uniref:Uncharacterized protein n=1 Tax=marine sediment metagenome TaxID=412755 RepID=A0A0F8ZCX7_9ZZZZ
MESYFTDMTKEKAVEREEEKAVEKAKEKSNEEGLEKCPTCGHPLTK